MVNNQFKSPLPEDIYRLAELEGEFSLLWRTPV